MALACLAAVLALQSAPTPAQTSASLPALGDTSEMSLSAERNLGDRIAREIYRDPDYVDDPLLSEYLQGIWAPLLASARARGELTPEMAERYAWVTMLIRERSINAFALPGGYMGVHLGLIGLVANHDELASVLAHELSHITQRHISRLSTQQARQAPWIIAAMVLGALAASKSPNAAGALITGGQAMAVQGQLNFSRDMEREADRIGFNVMAQAGYRPQGFVSMFEKLQAASRLNDNGAYPYLRSHPLTSERIADMQTRARELAAVPAAPSLAHAMLAARARVLAEPGVQTARLWAEEADSPQLQKAPLARQVAAHYTAALARARGREFAAAQSHWRRLEDLTQGERAGDGDAARVVRLLGVEIHLMAGAAGAALRLLAPEQLVGAAVPRPEMLLLAQAAQRQIQAAAPTALTGAAAPPETPPAVPAQTLSATLLQRLQTWVAAHPQDATAWQALGGLAAAAGQPLRALRAEAEAQAAHMDLPAALDRLKAAQDLVRRNGNRPADFFEASIIDTRQRQLEGQLKLDLREQSLQR